MGILVTRAQFANIMKLVKQANESETCELEARLTNNVDAYAFQKLLTYMTSKGHIPIYEPETLDIASTDSDIRISIIGLDNIATYCKRGTTSDVFGIRKQRKQQLVELTDYDIRFKTSTETEISNKEEILLQLNKWQNKHKNFRLKKRTSFKVADFRVDCTIIKMKQDIFLGTKNFNETQLTYEIEVEYIRSNNKPDDVAKSFLNILAEILKVVYDCEYLLPKGTVLDVLNEYHQLAFAKPLDLNILNRNPKSIVIGPQPVTLELANLADDYPICIKTNYTVTPKADGERCLVFVNNLGAVFTINTRATLKKTKLSCIDFKNSIFDAEIISKPDGKVIMLFDTYFVNGQSVCHLSLEDDNFASRLGHARIFIRQTNHKNDTRYKIIVKDFRIILNSTDLFKASKEFLELEKAHALGFLTDGLIFTPLKAPVGSTYLDPTTIKLSGTWDSVLKWKPPRDNTIDFLARIQKSPGSINDEIVNHSSFGLCKVLNLYVRGDISNTTAWDYWNNVPRKEGSIPVLFNPVTFDDNIDNSSVSKLFVNISQDGFIRCINNDVIDDNSIVECSWNLETNRWLPMRIRLDKTELLRIRKNIQGTTNDVRVADKIWKTIMNPVQVEHITGVIKVDNEVIKNDDTKYYSNDLRDRNKSHTINMVNFHNMWVKYRHLLQRLKGADCSSLADFGCGKGGDLFKWVDSGFTKILGLDLFSDNINNPLNGAYKRLQELPMKRRQFSKASHQYLFLTFDLSKRLTKEAIMEIPNTNEKQIAQIAFGYNQASTPTLKVLQDFAKERFDIVSCQFAIHYFFKNKDTLSNFIYNISKCLKPGGFFVGTCFDAQAVANKLDNNNDAGLIKGIVNGNLIWSIQRKYQHPFQPQTCGQTITVYLESINQYIDEYLVDYELLKNELAIMKIVEPSRETLDHLGLISNTGMFEELYNDMVTYVESKKGNIPNHEKWMAKVCANMTLQEKELSFYNRWFIFQKQ
jgi:SAM-dependent methyltransferase